MKTSSLGVNIALLLPLFGPKTPILGQEVLKSHANNYFVILYLPKMYANRRNFRVF